jgi:hypothetical protein
MHRELSQINALNFYLLDMPMVVSTESQIWIGSFGKNTDLY